MKSNTKKIIILSAVDIILLFAAVGMAIFASIYNADEFNGMPDKNNTDLAKTPLFPCFLANSRLKYVKYICIRLYQKSSKISAFWLIADKNLSQPRFSDVDYA